MSTDYTEHIDEAMNQLPNNPAVVPADNRTPQSPNITLEAWNRLQARLVALETLVAKLGKGGFATAVQEDVSALGSAFNTSMSDAVDQANDYTDDAVEAEAERAIAAENGKVSKVTDPNRLYGTDTSGDPKAYVVSSDPSTAEVPKYMQGALRVSKTEAPLDATSKSYVDQADNGKVNKLSGLESPAVYVGNPDGTQTHKYLDNGASGNSVPLRDANGNIHVGDATQTGHAVNLGTARSMIQEQIGRVYKPAGNISFAELINTVDLDETNLGNIYNIRNAFTTTSDFMEGAGVSYPEGTNVGVVQDGTHYYFDVFVGQLDLSNYVQKTDYASSSEAGVVKIDPNRGLSIGTDGRASINASGTGSVKSGTSSYMPLVPFYQHQAVFYALAKAAGVNLASSTEEAAPDGTNPGVYPASAIQAILKMLFPTPPSANGAYPLCCVVSNGTQVFGYISTAIIGTAVVGSSTVA